MSKGGTSMSKLSRLLVCFMIAAMSSVITLTPRTSFAKPTEERIANKEETVYATKRGKKYHEQDCRFIKNRDTTSMSKEEASTKGLKPCGRCFEDESK